MDRQRTTRLVVTGVAATAFIVHRWRPAILDFDKTELSLLVIAALPWLAYLVKAVELPGGVKFELQELREETERARGEALSASKQAATALGVATSSAVQQTPASADDDSVLQDLIQQYDRIRAAQERSQARTQAMTDVVNKMMVAAPRARRFDIADALRAPTEQRGLRLAAFARLWVEPDMKYLDQLVEAITRREDKPFGQYWGIMALKKTLAAHGGHALTRPQFRQLEDYVGRLPRDTDRFVELAPLLSELRRWQTAD